MSLVGDVFFMKTNRFGFFYRVGTARGTRRTCYNVTTLPRYSQAEITWRYVKSVATPAARRFLFIR